MHIVDLTPQNTSELQKFTISVLYFSKQPNSSRCSGKEARRYTGEDHESITLWQQNCGK